MADSDGCQRNRPMSFCSECGTWLHCKREGDTEYRRREEDVKKPVMDRMENYLM